MKQDQQKESVENLHLADSCGQANVICCKKGYIFLPPSEHNAIAEYLKDTTEALREFESRITDHGDFFLYDQKSNCQFLREDNLCQLHPIGIKPTECFWWPGHVYIGLDGLEIRVATCCGGCHHLKNNSPHIAKIAQQAEEIGHELLIKFRQIHNYGDDYKVVKKI